MCEIFKNRSFERGRTTVGTGDDDGKYEGNFRRNDPFRHLRSKQGEMPSVCFPDREQFAEKERSFKETLRILQNIPEVHRTTVSATAPCYQKQNFDLER